LSGPELTSFCEIRDDTLELLERAVRQLFLSPRACHRILKVARTIADLNFNQKINTHHVAEAIAFRRINTAGNNL